MINDDILVSANVRRLGLLDDIDISDGVGYEGDLVAIRTIIDEISIDVMGADGSSYYIEGEQIIIAVLGNRESSTHVSGGVPEEGIAICEDTQLHWIGGDSGIVGNLFLSPDANNEYSAEYAVKVCVLGLLYRNGNKINIKSLVEKPVITKLSIPVIFVSGTSAESGKTQLAIKIIKLLSQSGKKVSAVKATGSGGVLDSHAHLSAGAKMAYDQVDAGLITTYTMADNFLSCIHNVFLLSQQNDANVIVAELGGDLCWANNPQLLSFTDVTACVKGMFVVCNDAFSAIGVSKYISEFNIKFPVRYVASPFRNFDGMNKRFDRLINEIAIDPNSYESIGRSLDDFMM
jgi:hypothetical protein